MPDQLKIVLTPHVGKMHSQVGDQVVEIDVPHPQCFVAVNGERVGIYCGRDLGGGKYEPGKYLSFTKHMPEPLQAAIAEEVAKITGGIKKFNAPPPEEHEVTPDDD